MPRSRARAGPRATAPQLDGLPGGAAGQRQGGRGDGIERRRARGRACAAGVFTYSASPPPASSPSTSSPIARPATSAPTATTVPATSRPRVATLRPAQAEERAQQQRLAAHDVDVGGVEGGGADAQRRPRRRPATGTSATHGGAPPRVRRSGSGATPASCRSVRAAGVGVVLMRVLLRGTGTGRRVRRRRRGRSGTPARATGEYFSCSIAMTVWRVTPMRLASSACVIPSVSRSARMELVTFVGLTIRASPGGRRRCG